MTLTKVSFWITFKTFGLYCLRDTVLMHLLRKSDMKIEKNIEKETHTLCCVLRACLNGKLKRTGGGAKETNCS